MSAALISPFLLTNGAAVKYAAKVSISIWGALFIALLMNFEHPVWSMITGLITFFAADHAQVIKKCLAQCLSTVLGGLVGVALMGLLGQSPLLVGFCMTAIVFFVAALAFHTRDPNFTFCCGIFVLTIAIMIMVPVLMSPTTEVIVEIFIDRTGTVIAGLVWATFVSVALWPTYSSVGLRQSAHKLVTRVLSLDIAKMAYGAADHDVLGGIYGSIVEIEDMAGHADFEGRWGKRSATIGRALNQAAVEIVSELPVLQGVEDIASQALQRELEALQAAMAATLALPDGDPLRRLPLSRFVDDYTSTTLEADETIDGHHHREGVADVSRKLLHLVELHEGLLASKRLNVPGIRVARHLQLANCLITGTRSASLFASVFFLWYVTGWGFGFLIAIVPLIFSITLSKAPHADVVARRVFYGTIAAIPPGLLIFTLYAEAPSAFEISVLVGAPILFFALMGLTSMATFAFSLGFAISFIVLILPLNHPGLDTAFAIERSLSVAIGALFLSFLFMIFPRRALLSDPSNVGSLYTHNLQRYLFGPLGSPATPPSTEREVGLIIDKMVHVTVHEMPEKASAVIDKGSQAIFLLIQMRKAYLLLDPGERATAPGRYFRAWRDEVYCAYLGQGDLQEYSLSRVFDSNEPQSGDGSSRSGQLTLLDRSIRQALA
jgi:uncharacterized membrane protein YccC